MHILYEVLKNGGGCRLRSPVLRHHVVNDVVSMCQRNLLSRSTPEFTSLLRLGCRDHVPIYLLSYTVSQSRKTLNIYYKIVTRLT
jgi:hypothetical protein